jgi:hypothetical protein
MRYAPSGRDGEHEWVRGDDDAVAIVRLRSSCRRRHRVAVASVRGVRERAGQGEVGEWPRRRHGDHAFTIVTSSSSPRHCCERDGVRGGAGQGQGRGAHEVGVTWGMWAAHVGSLRAGEGRAHQKGDASGGGGERGRAGDCGRWRVVV